MSLSLLFLVKVSMSRLSHLDFFSDSRKAVLAASSFLSVSGFWKLTSGCVFNIILFLALVRLLTLEFSTILL